MESDDEQSSDSIYKKGGDTMRDLKITKRKTDLFTDKFARFWNKHPELRLYQVIILMMNIPNIQTLTDDEIYKKLQFLTK